MNVSHHLDNCSFRVKIDETSCSYFCDHFYKAIKEKVRVRASSILKQSSTREVIAYCIDCQNSIRRFLHGFDRLSDEFFYETKKY